MSTSSTIRPLRRPFVSGEAEINTPYSFEQRLSSAIEIIDWADGAGAGMRAASPIATSVTLDAMGNYKLIDKPWLGYYAGWGGALTVGLPPTARPSYRVLSGFRFGESKTEVSGMVSLDQFRLSAFDFSATVPMAGVATHVRVDRDLIHQSTFWSPRHETTHVPNDSTEQAIRKPLPLWRVGLGITVKKDMASGINLLCGFAKDIGDNSHIAFHADVLRRICGTLRSSVGPYSVGARIRTNLITLHDTALEVGASYLCNDNIKLRTAHTAEGQSFGFVIENVPKVLRAAENVEWLPTWLRGKDSAFTQWGEFDVSFGFLYHGSRSIAKRKDAHGNYPPATNPRLTAFLSLTAR